mmetsp:Transcript_17731/g.21271  ORF Transcript_17731/g.21271 Transcript_17731/m.21271 type:complete len:103 (+) Transcript_17731:425-733(+)
MCFIAVYLNLLRQMPYTSYANANYAQGLYAAAAGASAAGGASASGARSLAGAPSLAEAASPIAGSDAPPFSLLLLALVPFWRGRLGAAGAVRCHNCPDSNPV